MQYRPGKPTDFDHLETFVWQAIFPAFDVAGLTEEQRAENDLMVERARDTVLTALKLPEMHVLTAWDERRRAIAGYLIIDMGERQYAEITQLIVKRSEWGRGVGAELLKRALAIAGPHRGVQALVRAYNSRARAFFAKHGFEDTGESAGDYAISRTLLLREAEQPRVQITEVRPEELVAEDDFPTAEDEPPYDPIYEELPDLTLSVDEEPFPVTGHHALTTEEPEGSWTAPDPASSTLDEEQLSELEAFIANAKAKKAGMPPPERTAPARPAQKSRHPEIEFEVDYGIVDEPQAPAEVEADEMPEPEKQIPTSKGIDFEFAFDAVSEEGEQVEETITEVEAEELLELKEIPDPVTPPELRSELEDRLGDRLTAYFGTERLTDFLGLYRHDDNFTRIRDVALNSLAVWINERPEAHNLILRRKDRVMSDIVEYFIVETAQEIHGQDFPQKLLRYQGVDWKTVDLFRMVMDYLDFESEEETVYTDFVTMPTAVLKKATKSYLQATRDERVFFICDQSLFGGGKQGFAFTDSALYWKNVLQPAGSLTFTSLQILKVEDGHLLINGQYFDAGPQLNLKVALLLDKLRRLDLRGD